MIPGTQIAYMPRHTKYNIKHPDVEFGFVTSEIGDSHYCRYWRKRHLGELRTVANSELTLTGLLVKYDSVPQELVDELIAKLQKEPG